MSTDRQQQKCRWTGCWLKVADLDLVFCLRLKRSERCIELASYESCELKYSRNRKLVRKTCGCEQRVLCTYVRVYMMYSGNYEIVKTITPPPFRQRKMTFSKSINTILLLHLSEFTYINVSLYKLN